MSSNTSVSTSTVGNLRREPPPRPPPPKTKAALKKSGGHKSIAILSNLFGHKNSSIIPPQIPVPPSSSSSPKPTVQFFHQAEYVPVIKTQQNNTQLINFDDWPALSQSTIKKSNAVVESTCFDTRSDSASIDSFTSSASSPNNFGAISSGFEDDFTDYKLSFTATSRSTTFSSDPFESFDNFASGGGGSNVISPLPSTPNVKPLILSNIGSSSNSTTAAGSLNNTLRNGKSSSINMPTIIIPTKTKTSLSEAKRVCDVRNIKTNDENTLSLPMPTIPPPQLSCQESDLQDDENPCCVVLYNFESDIMDDLNLKVNEKVYLIKQMNDEWMFGRDKRGCEGIFPISYVEILVPLKVEPDSGTDSRSTSVSPPICPGIQIRATYTFNAENDEDLTIKEQEMINVFYEINPEWLYGSNENGDCGQFPANFIEYVPSNLPRMPTT